MALIIDAEMPHSCFNCSCIYRKVDGRYFCRHSDGLLYPLYYPMTNGCPILGEISDKHGWIVDISKVEDFLTKWENGELDYEPYLDEVLSIIRYSTKTIVEATE